jgi:hypothetical protein
MKVNKVNARFVKLGRPKEDCVGEWVATPKYEFRFTTHDLYDEPTIRMESYGFLSVSFEGGGELDFVCEVVYNLTQFNKETIIGDIVDVAYTKLPLDLEELFITWEVFIITSPDFDLWLPYEREQLYDLISKAIDDYNQKYGGL